MTQIRKDVMLSLFICGMQPAVRLTYKKYETAFFINEPVNINTFINTYLDPSIVALAKRETDDTA